MILSLDMKTAFVSVVLGHLFTVVLISAYRYGHKKDKLINTFYVSKWLEVIGWGLVIFRGSVPEYIYLSVVNSILFAGSAVETIALSMVQHAYNRKVKRRYLAFTLFSIIGFNILVFLDNAESTRIAFASFCTGMFLVYPVYRMMTSSYTSKLKRLMGYLYGIVVIGLFSRSAMSLFTGESMGFFTPNVYQALSFLSLYLIMILENTGFILLYKEQADERLIQMATSDDLTGTLNRRTFIEQAESYLTQLSRSRSSVSFILFDIDHYKNINDTYGHIAGDRVLASMSALIKEKLKDVGLFGRFGGDEFAILLPGMDEKQSGEAAEQLRQAVERMQVSSIPVNFTISMGIVTLDRRFEPDVSKLYKWCDQALYEAKRQGRNRVVRIRFTNEKQGVIEYV
ncbi:diguanylate cyclase [Paenibacillus sp. HJL G12]|uniref:Diguanylate cyclase n=1 Tax=Paenibacillus dendrobii TaxID=2691084 RepID=A0A7X3IKI9_9BACL|nr:GGDEF domain-containing protein [Paenibacillus dendrobii]MWV45642.1 diguanylate cyclase [Paenibacillus dendrobii]